MVAGAAKLRAISEAQIDLEDDAPTEGLVPPTDAVDFFLSPNATTSITSMLNATAR
jgi:hypothetical protein